MTDGYVVCPASALRVGDRMVEPWSGAMAKVTEVGKGKLRPVLLSLTLEVSQSKVALELNNDRPVRRRRRDGE